MRKNLLQRLLTCSVTIILFLAGSSSSSAQANFWTLFTHQLDCSTGALTTLPDQLQPNLATFLDDENVNSAYDASGNLLFSVNVYGVFDPTGHNVFAFGTGCGKPVSEIEVIPVLSQCNTYNILYWQVDVPKPGCTPGYKLVLWKVNSSGAAIGTANVIYYRAANVINYPGGGVGIVADKLDPTTGRRDVYALDYNTLLKCTFNPDGTYSSPVPIAGNLAVNTSDLFELATVNGVKTIAYAQNNNIFFTDLTTYAQTSFSVGGPDEIVSGFEYVPSVGVWYVSHLNRWTPNVGGISYYDPATTTYTAIAGTSDFRISDLELAKNGNLYVVGIGPNLPGPGNNVSGTPGHLAYINTATAPFAVPTYIIINSEFVKIKNIHDDTRYYLQNQIDDDDYSAYYNPHSGNSHDFSIDLEPRVVPHFPAAPPCATHEVCPQNLILYFAPFALGNALSYNQRYMISWTETDQCGNPIRTSPLNYTDRWHPGPAGSIDLKTYGNGALGSSAAIDHYFRVNVYIEDACGMTTWAPSDLIHIRINDPSVLATWKIKDNPSGSSYTAPGSDCFTAPGACGNDPVVRLDATNPNITQYWLVIKDYGNACPLAAPLQIFDGSATPVPITSPVVIDVVLNSYVNNYCGGPLNYFTANGNYIGVEVFVDNGCGVMSVGEQYFINNIGCKGTGVATQASNVSTAPTIIPNPTSNKSTLNFTMQAAGNVEVRIIDALGRLIDVPTSTTMQAGKQSIVINSDHFVPGIYQVILKTAEGTFSNRLSVVK